MCGWHVSSPSLLAGLIRAPLPREHYTQSRHLMALIHTHAPAVAPVELPNHLTDALLYSCFSFSLINLSLNKGKNIKNPYLVGCDKAMDACYTHTHTHLIQRCTDFLSD